MGSRMIALFADAPLQSQQQLFGSGWMLSIELLFVGIMMMLSGIVIAGCVALLLVRRAFQDAEDLSGHCNTDHEGQAR
jgi:hypothetical protein